MLRAVVESQSIEENCSANSSAESSPRSSMKRPETGDLKTIRQECPDPDDPRQLIRKKERKSQSMAVQDVDIFRVSSTGTPHRFPRNDLLSSRLTSFFSGQSSLSITVEGAAQVFDPYIMMG
ncbi:hypothetical protein RB195_014269 [Necator americanus]|uniref:Uncharacterized protein n=1 Tax=Necator americanus TaxID=51031 RepID=A0ABR1DZF9_NECAM